MQSLEIHIQPSRRFIHSSRMHRTSKIFYTTDSKKINSEYGPDKHNERLETLEFLYLVENSWQIFSKNSLIMTPKVKAAEVRAVKKKKIQKILHKILSQKTIFLHIFILKPNEEEQETEQFDMDMVVAEEYIEYYVDKYKKLIRKHKFAMPLCKLYNAIETTSNIPAGYYITSTFSEKGDQRMSE